MICLEGQWLPCSHFLSQHPIIGPLLLSRDGVYGCVCVCICVGACALACQTQMMHRWTQRSPELLWRHSVSLEKLETAEIVQSASFFTRLKLGIFSWDVPYLIAVEQCRNNRYRLWKSTTGSQIWPQWWKCDTAEQIFVISRECVLQGWMKPFVLKSWL